MKTWQVLFMVAVLGQAQGHVQRGIQQFESGDFAGAAKSFAEADVALPDDPRVAFNQACVRAAQGDVEKAVELFQIAALTRDSRLAASAQYNLGCVLAGQAKGLLGEEPENATPDQRQQGLTLIMQAISHYRDCLQLDDGHKNARHNLELLRLWIKHMQDLWAQRDREQQREEMGLLDFLEMIQTQQEGLRSSVRLLADQDDSPKRRQALNQTVSAQDQLTEEIEPLKQKIIAALEPPSPGGAGSAQPGTVQPPTGASTEDLEAARQALTGLADQAHQAMTNAADELEAQVIDGAISSQTDALDRLNEIYVNVAPFAHLLSKATANESRLVDASKYIIEQNEAEQQPSDSEESPPNDSDELTRDFAELARQQARVSQWAQILRPKAEQELKQLQSLPGPAAEDLSVDPQSVDPQSVDPQSVDPQSADPQQNEQAQQREAVQESLEKAIELGPEIFELTKDASDELADERPKVALPKQEEALKLLKEIAESFPKQPQDQNQQDNQQQQNQEDQDSDQQQQPQNQSDEQQQQPQRELSQQQAEAVLRRVRERERAHNELQKRLEQQIRGRAILDRDW